MEIRRPLCISGILKNSERKEERKKGRIVELHWHFNLLISFYFLKENFILFYFIFCLVNFSNLFHIISLP